MRDPIDLALFEGTLYWLKAGTGELTSYKLYGPRERRIGKHQLYSYNAEHFTILHSAMQPRGEVFIKLTVCSYITWLVFVILTAIPTCHKISVATVYFIRPIIIHVYSQILICLHFN